MPVLWNTWSVHSPKAVNKKRQPQSNKQTDITHQTHLILTLWLLLHCCCYKTQNYFIFIYGENVLILHPDWVKTLSIASIWLPNFWISCLSWISVWIELYWKTGKQKVIQFVKIALTVVLTSEKEDKSIGEFFFVCFFLSFWFRD